MDTDGQRMTSAYLALVWLFTCVDQVVLLEMGQLGETFTAGLTLEGSLTAVNSQVHLQTKYTVLPQHHIF